MQSRKVVYLLSSLLAIWELVLGSFPGETSNNMAAVASTTHCYELYFNGKLVSGPNTCKEWTEKTATDNCIWNTQTKPTLKVNCILNGKFLSGSPEDTSVLAKYKFSGKRTKVLPILFVPADYNLSAQDEAKAAYRFQKHLEISQQKYRELLQTDTFQSEPVHTFKSTQTYADLAAKGGAIVDHMMAEVLGWKGETLENSSYVYVMVIVRPTSCSAAGSGGCQGGGMTINGPNTGGLVILEYEALMADYPYRFQGTLIHELGHGFGLTHSDCYGFDMATAPSIMSYNQSFLTNGLSYPRGGFMPEDYFNISRNQNAFPNFSYKPIIHNPSRRLLQHVNQCVFSPREGEVIRNPFKGGSGKPSTINVMSISTSILR